MARAITKTKKPSKLLKAKSPTEMPLKPINYMIIAGGALLVLISFIILAENDTVYGFIPLNLVPILLFIGYIVVVPFGIMYRKRKNGASGAAQNQGQPTAK
jgi:uncharacterized RDD family membrane protein YckC